MRVTSSTFTDSLIRNLHELNERQVKLQKQVASGQKVERASDDPAATGRLMRAQSEKRELVHFRRNMERAEAINRTSYERIRNLHDLSTRAQEIATMAQGVTRPDDYAIYAGEVNQLLEQSLELANSRHGGHYLFAGEATDEKAFEATREAEGRVRTIEYRGEGESPQFLVAYGARISPYAESGSTTKLSAFLDSLVAVRDALETGGTEAIES